MKEILSALAQLGLTNREGSVYLASLKLGPSNVRQLAVEAGIKRSTLYSVMERLFSLGLLREEQRQFRRLIVPVEPLRLEELLERQKAALAKVLPDLESIFRLKETQMVLRQFEGVEAIRKLYRQSLEDVRPDDFYFVVSNSNLWLDIDESFMREFVERRAELYGDIRLLLRDSTVVREEQRHAARWNFRLKILPDSMTVNTTLIVIPRRVIIHRLVPPFAAVVFENKDVIVMMRELFENFWQLLPDAPAGNLGKRDRRG